MIEGEVALGRPADRFDAYGRLNDERLVDEVREVADDLLADADPENSGKPVA